MRAFSRLAVAIAITWISATAQAAQAANNHDGNGKILFTRSVLTPIMEGGGLVDYFPSGVALYTVDENGSHAHQLTPLREGHLFLPGLESNTRIWYGSPPVSWLAKNFSPDGQHIVYFDGLTSAFPIQQDSVSGKYKVMDAQGYSHALFPGNDDVSARYGFVTWGPPGSHEVAYTNSAENLPASPTCVFLVHPDGSDAHRLWCPESHGPDTAVSNLRWSGDGKSLLAYVNWDIESLPSPPNWGVYGYTELWRITVATGVATRVSAGIYFPLLGDSADISYDGTKVVYEQWAPYGLDTPACDPESSELGLGYTICMRDMTTGHTNVVWNGNADTNLQLSISPDGRDLVYGQYDNPPGAKNSESDLYLISTADGTVIRQLTQRRGAGLPDGSSVVWKPVAWSRDGQRLLANRFYYPPHVINVIKPPVVDIYVIKVGNGHARHVIDGNAEDWYQPIDDDSKVYGKTIGFTSHTH